ncbi:MAG: aminoacyl-tRNA hydrolase [Patescibacteria group bacterium]|jgi:PTH1 family peptidyl-tRNA hydrolase
MKIIVGLGNPGKEYTNTPHNAGFIAVEQLVSYLAKRDYQIYPWTELKKERSKVAEVYLPNTGRIAVLVMPQTFMNLSGGAVQQIMQKYGVKHAEDVMIIYDELDIELGGFKYSPIKNSRTHNGIASVISTVGKAVHSLRIGVNNRKGSPISGLDYVLRPYRQNEMDTLISAVSRGIEQHVLPFLDIV